MAERRRTCAAEVARAGSREDVGRQAMPASAARGRRGATEATACRPRCSPRQRGELLCGGAAYLGRPPPGGKSSAQKHVCPHDVLGHAAARRERPPLVHGRVLMAAVPEDEARPTARREGPRGGARGGRSIRRGSSRLRSQRLRPCRLCPCRLRPCRLPPAPRAAASATTIITITTVVVVRVESTRRAARREDGCLVSVEARLAASEASVDVEEQREG
eukprot:scaffold55927_cov63-Phaeocystis_antarctica.AAC.2